jgi:hypothetical protein
MDSQEEPFDTDETRESVQGPSIEDSDKLKSLTLDLGTLVHKYGEGSAAVGLTRLAVAFAILSDLYAGSNPDNPTGMCDNRKDLRKHLSKTFLRAPRFWK